jgi:hypothetical protein
VSSILFIWHNNFVNFSKTFMEKDQEQHSSNREYPSNEDQQAVDKAPGEEVGHSEQVTKEDLKGKKVDRDPSKDEEQPIRQLP